MCSFVALLVGGKSSKHGRFARCYRWHRSWSSDLQVCHFLKNAPSTLVPPLLDKDPTQSYLQDHGVEHILTPVLSIILQGLLITVHSSSTKIGWIALPAFLIHFFVAWRAWSTVLRSASSMSAFSSGASVTDKTDQTTCRTEGQFYQKCQNYWLALLLLTGSMYDIVLFDEWGSPSLLCFCLMARTCAFLLELGFFFQLPVALWVTFSPFFSVLSL